MPTESQSAAASSAASPTGSEGRTSMSELLAQFDPEVREALGADKPDHQEAAEHQENPEQETAEEHNGDPGENEAPEHQEEEIEEHQVPAGVQKRIDKLTSKVTAAEKEASEAKAENARLKEEVEKRSAITLAPTPDDPLADVESPEALDARINDARRIRAWALAHPDGATITDTTTGKERHIDRAEMAAFVASTDALLTEHAPARKEYLRQRSEVLPVARKVYPELFSAGTEAHRIMVDTLKAIPALKRMPGYELVIGDAIVGMQMRLQQDAKAAGGKPTATTATTAAAVAKPKIAPVIPRAAGSGKPPSTTGKTKDAALKRVLDEGDADSLTEYFRAG